MAIARAYMREAELIILDEPTAALDAKAEAEVFQRFKGLAAGKTAVLISHRFSTVRMADRILVSPTGASSNPARMTSWWRAAASMPTCSSCRRPGIAEVRQAASFRPMMPVTIRPMQAMRTGVAGSPSSQMPRIAVPTVPMPVQTA